MTPTEAEEEASIAALAGSPGLLAWQKYTVLARHHEKLTIADKRAIFGIMRRYRQTEGLETEGLENHYLPAFGVTLGEFSMFHTIGEHVAKTRKQRQSENKR